MSHLHTLHIHPQIYCDILEGDSNNPYYLYIGATEDYPRRFTQKRLGYDAYKNGNNDGWSTPDFTRKHHRVKCPLSVEFVEGGQACANSELDTFMKWFHLHGCNMNIVRGADWCKANPLRWTDHKFCGRNVRGPTLRDAYDKWVASGRAAEIDVHKDAYIGYIQALL
jgi:hypothetical protein